MVPFKEGGEPVNNLVCKKRDAEKDNTKNFPYFSKKIARLLKARMEHIPVLIIGAGPAGLAIAGRLQKRGIAFEIIERFGRVGNSWHEHYERLHLHTVKEMSHLPFLPFPDDYPRYVPRDLLCAYFKDYAETFDIKPRFGEEVAEVFRLENGRWQVNTSGGWKCTADHVIFATGVNRIPNRPHFEGEERFKGEFIHSRKYVNARPYRGKRVLVVGMGNTGAEIALDLAENGAEPFVSVRGPVNIVPRDFLGRPTQKTALMLSRLPEWLGDWIGKMVRRISMGDLQRYGLRFTEMSPIRQLRELGKTPVVDVGTADQIRLGKIKILPQITRFFENGAIFTNGRHYTFDAVILATGYRAQIQDFLQDVDGLLDERGIPKCIGEGPHKGLYFLGFDNYTAGGILGVINSESGLLADRIAAAFQPAGSADPA